MNLRIREHRKSARMSQDDLAKAVKVSRRTLGSWERNETVPDAEQLWGLAVTLGTDLNSLVGWDDASTGLTAEESTMLRDFRRCSAETQSNIRALAQMGASREPEVLQVGVGKGA